MGKRYCIVCGKEKNGIGIGDDYVLDSIRWFKRNVTKNEAHNTLVVCKDCYPEYKKSRKKYESRQRLYIALGIVFVVMMIYIGGLTAQALLVSIFILILFYLFSLLSYTPKIEIKKQHEHTT